MELPVGSRRPGEPEQVLLGGGHEVAQYPARPSPVQGPHHLWKAVERDGFGLSEIVALGDRPPT